MNTTEIGNNFEDRVFKIFSKELEESRLGINPDYCKIYQKKGYYSKDRGNDIVFDISIEVFLPEQETLFMLMIFECKDYSSSVPVDDVEEFNSKLQQVAGRNVKGIMATSSDFQKSAFNYAQSNGIAIVRLLNHKDFKWELTRATTSYTTISLNKSQTILQGLIDQSFRNDHIDFYSNFRNIFTYSARELVVSLLKSTETTKNESISISKILVSDIQKDLVVPYLTKEEIETKADELLNLAIGTITYKKLESIIKILEQQKKIKFRYIENLGMDTEGFEILGKISFSPNIITISKSSNTNYHRKRFTIAHELGHYYLEHNNYMTNEFYSEKDEVAEKDIEISIKEISRMEWQANYFASCLLLPKNPFLETYLELCQKEDIRRNFGILFLDNQQCNKNTFYRITNYLKSEFQVSRKVIEIRLKNMNLLEDIRTKSIQLFK